MTESPAPQAHSPAFVRVGKYAIPFVLAGISLAADLPAVEERVGKVLVRSIVAIAVVIWLVWVLWEPVRRRVAAVRDEWHDVRRKREQVLSRLASVEQLVEASGARTQQAVAELKQNVVDLHQATESLLFGRLAGLSDYRHPSYDIYFTHKGEKLHTEKPGSGERYLMTPFPYDEGQTILWLWYQVAQNLRISPHHVRPLCGCTFEPSDVLQGSFAVIGSPKANKVCAAVMNAVEELTDKLLIREHRYIMAADNDSAYLRTDTKRPHELWPSSTKEAVRQGQPVKDLIDYAMFMRLPNILSSDPRSGNDSILVLAGCKVAGQVALTEWLSNPHNLTDIHDRYADRPFDFALKVKYNFVPNALPEITEVTPMAEIGGPISLKS